MRLFFIRHGQAEHNKSMVLNETNQIVSNLTPKGRAEVRRSARQLAEDVEIDTIYCSPLIRCQQTAQIVKETQKKAALPVKTYKCLGEFRTGFNNRTPLKWWIKLLLSRDRWNKKFNNGQSLAESSQDLRQFLNKIIKRHPQDNILIVGHLYTFQALYYIFYNQNVAIPWLWHHKIYTSTGEVQELRPQKSK